MVSAGLELRRCPSKRPIFDIVKMASSFQPPSVSNTKCYTHCTTRAAIFSVLSNFQINDHGLDYFYPYVDMATHLDHLLALNWLYPNTTLYTGACSVNITMLYCYIYLHVLDKLRYGQAIPPHLLPPPTALLSPSHSRQYRVDEGTSILLHGQGFHLGKLKFI